MKARFAAILLVVSLLFAFALPGWTHPYPDSAIDIRMNGEGVSLDFSIPAPELVLAMTGKRQQDAKQFLEGNLPALRAYLADHIAVIGESGAPLGLELGPVTLERASDSHVGTYDVFRFNAVASAGSDLKSLSLRYDAIIREIPSHAAEVRAYPVAAEDKPVFSTIRYDFSDRNVPPLALTFGSGGE